MRKFVLAFMFLSLISCKEEINIEEENTYQIVNFLIHKYKDSGLLKPSFPPPSNNGEHNFSTRDSLNIYKYFSKEFFRKKTIALSTKMSGIAKELKFENNCKINHKLLSSFLEKKKQYNIDFKKIVSLKKDSLISYFEFNEIKEKRREIDVNINFSRVAFSNDYKHAIIIIGVSFGKHNSFSEFIYLEKENYNWEIKCIKGLSIS